MIYKPHIWYCKTQRQSISRCMKTVLLEHDLQPLDRTLFWETLSPKCWKLNIFTCFFLLKNAVHWMLLRMLLGSTGFIRRVGLQKKIRRLDFLLNMDLHLKVESLYKSNWDKKKSVATWTSVKSTQPNCLNFYFKPNLVILLMIMTFSCLCCEVISLINSSDWNLRNSCIIF